MGEKYEAKWLVSVDDVVSTFRYIYDQVDGTVSPEAARSAGVALANAQLVPLTQVIGTGARVEAIYTRKITGDPIPAWWGNFENQVGTIGGNPLHAQQCLLVNLRNSEGLLKRSGRVFISGVGRDDLAAGVFSAAFLQIQVQNYLDTLIDVPAGGTDNWAGKLQVERNQIDLVPQVPPVYVEVDSVDATETVGTQHRRKGQLRGYQPFGV